MKYLKSHARTLLSLVLTFFIAQAFGQQVFKTTPTSVIGYLEYLPAGYNNNSDKYPIVIFLHGLGERGPNSTSKSVLEDGISLVTRHGPPKHIKNGVNFPFIVISPQLKNNYGSWPSSYVMEVINHCKDYLRIDERRIYITGLSLGGGGTWVMAQDYTKLFAAAAPVCGSQNSLSKAINIASENLPIWAFHGDADPTVPLSRSVNMVNAINNCYPVPNPKAIMTIYPGIKHNSWDKAYTPDHTYHNPNVYEWLMSKTNTINAGNRIPVANAGADVTRALSSSSFTISGSGTDTDGSIASYSWTKMSGPSVTLINSTSATLTLSNVVQGEYVFRLKVTDNRGDTDSDYVKVTITAGTSNAAPVVNAGADLTITLPTNSVTITGTASDTDGTITSYSWTKVSGGAATLSGATTSRLTASGLIAGTYVFRLTVKDDDGATKSDDVTVTVNPAANVAPVVSAGADLSITLPTNSVTITGTASDSDGTIASYSWTKVSGGAATLSGATTARLTASALVAGTYVFRLTAKDDDGAAKSDDVTVTVKTAVTSKIAPVANAGEDKIIKLPATSAWLRGTGSDADGSVVSYQWTQVSGPVLNLSYANTAEAKLSRFPTTSGVCVFRLTVTDNSGLRGYDDVKVTLNYAPVANAGPDITVTLPKSSLIIKGTGTDQDGTIVSYRWQKKSGPSVTMTNSTTASLTLTNLTAGTYSFRFAVLDNVGVEHVDYMTLIVKAASTSLPDRDPKTAPVANAGEDKVIRLPATSAWLRGTASDADGSVASYQWTQVSGPALNLSYANTAEAKLSGFPTTSGVCVFRLTVADNDGLRHYDDVKVTLNYEPVANAGADVTVTLPQSSLIIKGTGTDKDGTIVAYKWQKKSGPSVTMTNNTTASLTLTDLTAGTYSFRFAVWDNVGLEHVDYMTLIVKSGTVAAANVKDTSLDKTVESNDSALAEGDTGNEENAGGASPEEDDRTLEEENVTLTEENTDFMEQNVSVALDIRDDAFWRNKQVRIFDNAGRTVYAGAWSAETYAQVFQSPGLYIYHVLQGERRINVGKIYITP